MSEKIRLATVWLDGCSGCHMSLLDTDERLIDIARRVTVVWGPLVDHKEFPENVDVALVEGAISSEEDLHRIRIVRARTKILVSLGDCAVTSNVPGMRSPIGTLPILQRAYVENVTVNPGIPTEVVPKLLPKAMPVHRVVEVDVFLPGCPPSADLIHGLLLDLLDGREPEDRGARFGR